MSGKDSVWFITGCSTGFGRELAKAVLGHGYRAAITARDPKSIEDIAAIDCDRALVQGQSEVWAIWVDLRPG
jgi:NAD(P)-dependent dehydrogenase (short-subunit alcohol dehydrogenase family)